jgi:hypothetical protein
MAIMRQHIGPSFRITLPGFRPAVLSGPEPNRAIMVTQRDKLRWRSETDPVTKLLRRGVQEDAETMFRILTGGDEA